MALDLELEQGLKDILARGGCVFPICSDSKRPLPMSGEDIGQPHKGGYKLATNDPRIVWHYFRGDPLPSDMPVAALKLLSLWRRTEQPNAAVALDMSGMLALDADNLDELEEFQKRYASLPATYSVGSPRANGGRHYYFKAGNNQYRRSIEGFPHLDIKHHGYVLIPGSVKRDDNGTIVGRYEVIDSSPIVEIPNWLLVLTKRSKTAAAVTPRVEDEWGSCLDGWLIQRARAYVAKMPPAISGNGGHNATFAAACALVRGFALSEEAAYEIMANDYNLRCEPPWTEWELRHKIRSAFKCASTPTGYLIDAQDTRKIKSEGYDIKFDMETLW